MNIQITKLDLYSCNNRITDYAWGDIQPTIELEFGINKTKYVKVNTWYKISDYVRYCVKDFISDNFNVWRRS